MGGAGGESTKNAPIPTTTNVPKSDSTNYSNPTINDKATITCDVDIPKKTLACEAYPIPDDSYPKWSSNIGGFSNMTLKTVLQSQGHSSQFFTYSEKL